MSGRGRGAGRGSLEQLGDPAPGPSPPWAPRQHPPPRPRPPCAGAAGHVARLPVAPVSSSCRSRRFVCVNRHALGKVSHIGGQTYPRSPGHRPAGGCGGRGAVLPRGQPGAQVTEGERSPYRREAAGTQQGPAARLRPSASGSPVAESPTFRGRGWWLEPTLPPPASHARVRRVLL